MQQAPAVPFRRDEMVAALATGDPFDLLVIGGGITGAGVALDAASRGLRVALVERDDFASGTSSKSSKLIHGGLRYLQQGDVRLVYAALHERQRLLRNAPHLVAVLPFLIPVLTRDGPVSKRIARALRAALWTYDLTGGLRIGMRHRRLDAAEALALCPTMPAEQVSSGFLYHDASADDARLTLAVARTAAAHGAVVANRCAVIALESDASGRAAGAVVRTGERDVTVRARAIVSATGVWADAVSELDGGRHAGIRAAKGIHVTLPWDLVRNEVAVIVTAPGDRRSLFLVPAGARPGGGFDHCYAGTTDTDYHGDLDTPRAGRDDVDYVLRAVRRNLAAPITAADVTATWAGLRPLAAGAASARTADLSRRHRIVESPSGVITVTGGKLTTYRAMAEDAVDRVARRLGTAERCRTRRLALWGADGFDAASAPAADHLAHRYGTDAATVRALAAADAALAEPLVPGLRYLAAEAVHAARAEMATTLEDVLARRTRAHLEDRAACRAAAGRVARLLAPELGWSEAGTAAQVQAYQALCAAEESAQRSPTEPSAP